MSSAAGPTVADSLKLAIDGGPPVRTEPFPAWPQFEADEIGAVAAVLRSGRVNYWTGSEIYLEKAFDGIRPLSRLPVAKELGETGLMFQVHPTLSDSDIQDTIAAIEKVMGHASSSAGESRMQ